MAILLEVSPINPYSADRVTMRFCSADDATLTGLNGVVWWPGILRSPSLNRDIFNGGFDSSVALAQIAVTISLAGLLNADPSGPLFRFAGAPLTIYTGDLGASWDQFSLLFRGYVTDFGIENSVLSLSGQVDSEPFDGNILEVYYGGAGGADGTADLKDKSKPAVFGYAMNIEPVPLNTVDSVFQVHGYGPVEDIVMVYERAASFGASSGNYASYAALVAATIAPGSWATCKAQGMFRLGAPPAGLITADVKGDNTGGWHRTTAAIIRRLCAIAEVAAADNLLPDDLFASGANWIFPTGSSQIAQGAGSGFAIGNAPFLLSWPVPSLAFSREEANTYVNRSPVTPGSTYFASAWAQKNAAVPADTLLAVGMTFFDAGGVQVGRVGNVFMSDALVAGDPPKRFVVSGVAPATAATTDLFLFIEPRAGAAGAIRWEYPRLDPSPVDEDSLGAFETAVPYPINLYITVPERVMDLLQRLARPCNAQVSLSWTGLLQATSFNVIPSPVITLDVQGRMLPPVLDNAEQNVSPPFWRIEMGANRSWRLHSKDEIALA